MNVFDSVKQSVTTREAAELYGIRVNRKGMACCPFHEDKHPSMKVDQRYHCFGCQADGDVIDFTAALFDLPVREATVTLAEDFGIACEDPAHGTPGARDKPKSVISDDLKFKKAEDRCYNALRDYRRLLIEWREAYAPKSPDEEWHPLFVESLQRLTYVGYLLEDVFLCGSIADRAEFIKNHGKDVSQLERRIQEFASGGTGGRDDRDRRHDRLSER